MHFLPHRSAAFGSHGLTIALLTIVGCAEDPPPVDAGLTQVAQDAPVLDLEVRVSSGLAPGRTVALQAADGSTSPGACIAWGTRKSAKARSAPYRYLQCAIKKAAQAGLVGAREDGTNWYHLHNLPPDANRAAGLISNIATHGASGRFTASVCGLQDPEPQEHARITIEETADGHVIDVFYSSPPSPESELQERSSESVHYDTTVEGEERYSYFSHNNLGQNADACPGPSVLTADGSADGVCYFRNEGTLVNYDSGAVDAVLTGFRVFKELIPGGGPAAAGAFAHQTAFKGGNGATLYGYEQGALYPSTTQVESWSATDFKAGPENAALVAELAGTTPPAHSPALPTIPAPAFDCPTFAEVDEQFFDVDVGAIPGIEECVYDAVRGGDAADCDPGNPNLDNAVNGFICDEADPLTSSDGVECLDCEIVGC